MDYDLIRSKRKTLALHIKNARLEVRAPLNYPANLIDAFIQKKQNWVEKNIQRHLQRKLLDNEIYIFGNKYTIKIEKSYLVETVRLNGEFLYLYTKNPTNSQKLIGKFLLELAENYIKSRYYEISRVMNITNTPMLKLQFFKRKWGSYHPRDNLIKLNPYLLYAEKECIDMVIMHEFCHIEHRNHGRGFYAKLSQFCPDYKNKQNVLKEKYSIGE